MKSAALKFLHLYLAYSTPLALFVMLDGQVWPHVLPTGVIGEGIFNTLMGSIFLLWLFSLLAFLVRLAGSEEYRTFCFKKIVGLSERDEREEKIVGEAAKSSFLLMLALLLVLFFISTWRYGDQPEKPGDNRSLTIGHLNLVEQVSEHDATSGITFYSLPVSKTSLLIALIGIQIASFRAFRRRAEKSI